MTLSDVAARSEPVPPAARVMPNTARLRRRPSRARWLLVGLLPAVAISSALLWLYAAWTAVDASAKTFTRAHVPGEVVVEVHPGTWYVYVEGASDRHAAQVRVTDPDGRALTVKRYFASRSYDYGGSQGQAVAKFDVPRGVVGEAHVSVTGTLDPYNQTSFAVGDFNTAGFGRPQLWGICALLLVNIGAALAIALSPLVRRQDKEIENGPVDSA